MKLLLKILRQNVNPWQILSFVLAILVGGTIVLTGIQTYRDCDRVLAAGDNVLGNELLVISKPVGNMGALSSILGMEPRFSASEVETLRQLPTVGGVGAFVPARCQVSGQIAVGTLNMVTDMFLESVPDSFLDVALAGQRWSASIDDREVPIIIPRSYLNLYNYGYAATRGLPQMSEGLVTQFPLRLMLSGNGQRREYQARILGFSDKLNTILAPQDFIEAVNATMQTEKTKQPSRLIVATKAGKENSKELMAYVGRQGYVVEGDADAVRMQAVVHGVLMALIAVGLLVSALAFYLLVVSILLLLEKNRERIRTLRFLGYRAATIARPYQLAVGVVDVVVWLVAAGIVWMVYPAVSDVLRALSPDFVPVSSLGLFAAALGFGLAFALLHAVMVRREVGRA